MRKLLFYCYLMLLLLSNNFLYKTEVKLIIPENSYSMTLIESIEIGISIRVSFFVETIDISKIKA